MGAAAPQNSSCHRRLRRGAIQTRRRNHYRKTYATRAAGAARHAALRAAASEKGDGGAREARGGGARGEAKAEKDAAEKPESDRLAAIEAAKEAGKAKARQEAESRAQKDAERRAELAEQRRAANGSSGDSSTAAAAAGGAPSAAEPPPPMSRTERIACILSAHARQGTDELKPQAVASALPNAQQIYPLDDGVTCLVAFGSAGEAKKALVDSVTPTFKLVGLTLEYGDAAGEGGGTPASILAAALALEITPTGGGGGAGGKAGARDSSTATRLITRNIEPLEEKAEARKIAQEKRAGALEAAKEAKEQAAEAERRRKAEFDAV